MKKWIWILYIYMYAYTYTNIYALNIPVCWLPELIGDLKEVADGW